MLPNKMKFFVAALLALVICSVAPSQAATIGGSYPITATEGQVLVLNGKTFAGANTADLLGQTVADCAANSTNRNKCLAFFAFSDPRWWGNGTNVCTSNFSNNSNLDDDTSEIQSALNSGYPVRIPNPGCKLANKLNFTNEGQIIYSDGAGGRYNQNIPGNGPYIFVPNDLWTNRATSLNCAIDSRGYDNVTVRNIVIRANFASVGSVAFCNSVGIQGGRAAAFINLENVAVLNFGNGIGAAMTSYFDYDGTSTTSNSISTGSKSFTTDTGKLWVPSDVITATAVGQSASLIGTVTSYNSGTGALVMDATSVTGSGGPFTLWSINTGNKCTPITTGPQAPLYAQVFQFRVKGLDLIGNCMGIYSNYTDAHVTDYYGAAIAHNVISGIPGFGGSGDFTNGRIEYSGFGSGPSAARTYHQYGAGVYYDSPLYEHFTNLACDHMQGQCVRAGVNAKNLSLTNITSFGSYWNGVAGNDGSCHFKFEGIDGLSATGIGTQRNGVSTDYVACFTGTNNYVNWQGVGGAQGSGAVTGQWQVGYFNFGTTPTKFTYNVPGVGFYTDSEVPTTINGLLGYTETPYNAGNSSTALTLSLANGTYQQITATGNATITMPTAVNGKSFTVRYYTGAGSFTATFTGVKWSGGTVPTLTATASRMDVFTFISDGTNWYGSVAQNFTP